MKNILVLLLIFDPLKALSKRMKNYIRVEYGNFDELIKTVQKCKNTVEKKINSIAIKILM